MKQRPPLADAACVRLHSPCRVGRRLTLLRLSLWHLILTYCRPNFCSCSTCVRPQPLFYAFLRARGPHAVRPLCVLFRPWPFLYVLFRPFCAPARPCVWPLWPLLCLFGLGLPGLFLGFAQGLFLCGETYGCLTLRLLLGLGEFFGLAAGYGLTALFLTLCFFGPAAFFGLALLFGYESGHLIAQLVDLGLFPGQMGLKGRLIGTQVTHHFILPRFLCGEFLLGLKFAAEHHIFIGFGTMQVIVLLFSTATLASMSWMRASFHSEKSLR